MTIIDNTPLDTAAQWVTVRALSAWVAERAGIGGGQ